jgi:transcriptional regulator with XRE-family HTH domain
MSSTEKIKEFLNLKLQELKISRKHFIQESGISASVVCGLINGIQTNPTLITIIKMANYFQCSVDEILGRDQYFNNQNALIFNHISCEQLSNNIKLYINTILQQKNIDSHQLSKLSGLGHDTIFKLMNNHVKKVLTLKSIISIADYLNISVDEIIGRINNMKY